MYHQTKWKSLFLILALLVLAACAATDSTTTDPVTDTNGQTSPTTTANLPPLPRLEAGVGLGAGGGYGGGGDAAQVATEALAVPEPGMAMDADKMSLAPYDVFSGTQFVLNATLPSEPTQAMVQRAPEYALTAEQANAWAAQFGFPTPVYQEVYSADFYTNFPADMGQPRMPYFAFNGTAQLTLSGYGAFYYDSAVQDNYPSQVDFGQSGPMAEAFLRQWGVLDSFPYVIEEGYNGDVTFKRVVAGQPLNYAEIYVHFNNNYEIVYVNYSPIMGLQELGQYPLITAQAAWDKIQAGITSQDMPYEILPSAEQMEHIIDDPYAGEYQFWQRVYAPGDAIIGYNGISAYRPTTGGTPLVRYQNYVIVASEADLNQLADNVGRHVVVEGNIGDDGRTLNLTNWAASENYPETLYLDGVVNASDQPNTLLFTSVDGVNYLIPNAPADLPAGTEVYVFAWAVRETGGSAPSLEWQSIDKKVYYPEYENSSDDVSTSDEGSAEILPMPIEPGFGYGYGYTNITITSVELTYFYMPQWEVYPTDGSIPSFDVPPVVLQPVWKFTGTAEGSFPYVENIALYIQAVDPAHVQP